METVEQEKDGSTDVASDTGRDLSNISKGINPFLYSPTPGWRRPETAGSNSPIITERKIQAPLSSGGQNDRYPSLAIYCLGPFRLYLNDRLIKNWTSRKAQAIMKYLVTHYPSPVSKDILMDALWREADPESARRNLHQAIYTLRQILNERTPGFQFVLFEEEQYRLNPQANMWLDFVEFERHCEMGQRLERIQQVVEAIHAYEVAEYLYQGDFMGDDIYEDLPVVRRQYYWQLYLSTAYGLSQHYLNQGQTVAAIAINQRVLERDKTQEYAHQNLVKCYIRQGQRNLAIRQYQTCIEILEDELHLPPSIETREMYQLITQM